MRHWFKRVALVLTLAYPFLVYWGLQSANVWPTVIFLGGLITLRALSGNSRGESVILGATFVSIIGIMLWGGQQLGLKFYPVMINLSFLFFFLQSYLFPPTVVERIARLREPNLPASAIQYLQRVTLAWCGLFVINGSAALYTALWGTDEQWLLYNGCIAYLLMGILAGGEWLLRQRVRQG